MNHSYTPLDYINAAIEYNELEKMSFSENESKDNVIKALEKKSLRKKEIYEICNSVIEEYVTKYEKDPSLVDEKSIPILEKFFNDLNSKNIDDVIQYKLATLIKNYYRNINDEANYYKYFDFANNKGSYTHSNHSNLYNFFEFEKEVDDAINKIEDLNLVERDHVLRILVSTNIMSPKLSTILGKEYDFEGLFKKVNTVLKYKDGCERGPNSSAATSMNCLGIFSGLCYYSDIIGKKVDIEKIRPEMMKVIDYVDSQIESKEIFKIVPKGYLYTTYLRTKFYLGLITLEEMFKEIDDCIEETIKENNPISMIFGVPGLNYNYLIFLNRYSKLSKEEIKKISKERLDKYLPTVLGLNNTVTSAQFNFNVVLFVAAASYTSNFNDFSDIMLKYSIYSDKPLYIHTEMVKEISLIIFDYLIENNPKCLEGVASKDTNYIINHKEEMRALLANCCMFHDIGKFFMLDFVENSMRKLTDIEYNIIKLHPQSFEDFYEYDLVNTEEVKCVHDCALTHHLWHDGTKGYPKIKQTYNRPFSDILAIADAIDAATDVYGRPYREPKPLSELINEFKKGANTQYGADAVNALDDSDVINKIQNIITERRKEINYQIYCFNKLK